MGNTKEMITAYLNAIEYQENRMSSIQTIFQRFFSDKDYQELQSQLLQVTIRLPRIQLLQHLILQSQLLKRELQVLRSQL